MIVYESLLSFWLEYTNGLQKGFSYETIPNKGWETLYRPYFSQAGYELVPSYARRT